LPAPAIRWRDGDGEPKRRGIRALQPLAAAAATIELYDASRLEKL
jgi:hypothetical protein